MKIRFGKKFSKQYDKSPAQIKLNFNQRLKLFLEDPFNPLLSNHPLTGKLLGFRSINITGDWRAIYSERKSTEEVVVVFELIGTHSQLYG